MHDPLVNGIYQPYSPSASNRGYSGPLQQWYETNFDPTSGYTNRVEYKAMDWTRAQALADYFTALGISANLKNEHGVSTLTITDATRNYVIDKWELSVDREQPDMFENPLFLALMNQAAYPQSAIHIFKNALKNTNNDSDEDQDSGWNLLVRVNATPVTIDPLTGEPLASSPVSPNQTALKFLSALGKDFYAPYSQLGQFTCANMLKLYEYFTSYQLGVTNFMRGKYKLRHTSNIPARWQVSVADFNVEKIYTIPQLIAECTVSGFIYPLPNYLQYKINNFVPDNVSAWTPYYTWGALKEKSDAVTAVNNRIDLTTEYLIDNISTLLYSLK
jgi:hypothetical protein